MSRVFMNVNPAIPFRRLFVTDTGTTVSGCARWCLRTQVKYVTILHDVANLCVVFLRRSHESPSLMMWWPRMPLCDHETQSSYHLLSSC